MNYDKGYFDTPEFRELLKRYEQAKAMSTSTYFGIDEFADLLSYYLYAEKNSEAEEILAMAKHLHPSATETKKMEVKVLMSKGEAKEALKLFSTIEIIDNDARILLGEIYIGLKDFRNAREIALDVLRDEETSQEHRYEALEIMLDCGCALEALLLCEKELSTDPKNRSLLEVKAECYIELQKTNEAIDIYNALLDNDPYSTFYWEQLGHIYFMVKRYGKALECFEYENTINEEIEYARMMQAYCYYHVGDYAKSRELFGWFKEKYPMSVMPQFYIALSLYHEGEVAESLKAFNGIIDIAPEGTIEMMLARIDKAMILESIGEAERAEESASVALMMHPDNMKQLLLHNGTLYELRDRENLTFSDMCILEQKEWKQDEELYELGSFLVERGLLKTALRVFHYIRPFSHETTEIDAHIAYILWNTGHKEEAASAIENALNGKSDLLFRLFGIRYNANLSPEEFMEKANSK